VYHSVHCSRVWCSVVSDECIRVCTVSVCVVKCVVCMCMYIYVCVCCDDDDDECVRVCMCMYDADREMYDRNVVNAD
jgi:hypothetical protein